MILRCASALQSVRVFFIGGSRRSGVVYAVCGSNSWRGRRRGIDLEARAGASSSMHRAGRRFGCVTSLEGLLPDGELVRVESKA